MSTGDPHSTTTPSATPPHRPAPRWQPVTAIDRRVLGVLAEKAKTTPDAYPMSSNAICTGANQKNNRHPLMQLQPDDVEASLERLRALGAVAEVQGGGRVPKYRHYLYDWLGVDKVEMAVMTELLLRGAQTVGELRGRAARMEPIADLAALRPVIDSLKAKRLVITLSPEGRGQVVSHALYQPQEMDKVRREAAGSAAMGSELGEGPAGLASSSADVTEPVARPQTARPPAAVHTSTGSAEALADLRSELAAVRRQVEELASELRRQADEFARFRAEVGG
ncbi:MAG TPA: DUF480 domain-containing protein [Pirellulales bacterium]|nr:DUF480 domain-containing protein [Pirellulales bacterium]